MKNIKKLLSLLLCGIMLFGMFPASLFAADGDTGDGSGTISETFVPKITWKRTFEYEHRHKDPEHQRTDLGGLYAGDKKNYFSTTSSTSNNTTTYKSTVTWDWAALSGHFNGQAEVDNSNHKVWDYGYTDVQYADPITDSIENPIDKDKTIGSIGIIPYAPSASEQAIFAATWNNRAAQEFKASSVDGTDIYYSGNYVSVKQGQMDIGYGKKASDSTISTFSGKSYTTRRFSGSFVWPEGYTLSDSIELVSKNDSYYQEIYDVIEKIPTLKRFSAARKLLQSTMICSCSSIRTATNRLKTITPIILHSLQARRARAFGPGSIANLRISTGAMNGTLPNLQPTAINTRQRHSTGFCRTLIPLAQTEALQGFPQSFPARMQTVQQPQPPV